MGLPRTIDKFRALLPGGNPGCYFINAHIVGLSGYLLERLGVSQSDFQAVVARAEDEAEIAAWLREHADPAAYAEINATLPRIRLQHSQDPAFVRELYAETMELHPDLVAMIDIVDADDRRMFAHT